MRIEIQNRINALCLAGTFARVSYAKTTDIATASTSDFLEPRVVLNEIGGTLTPALSRSPRSRSFTQDNWLFEARLKFQSEVDITYFLENELDVIAFTYDNQRIRTNNIGYQIEHPPRQGSHNGTELILTFSLTTRR